MTKWSRLGGWTPEGNTLTLSVRLYGVSGGKLCLPLTGSLGQRHEIMTSEVKSNSGTKGT